MSSGRTKEPSRRGGKIERDRFVKGAWPRSPISRLIRIASGQVDPRSAPFSSMLHVGPDNIPSGGGRLVGTLLKAQEQGLVSGKYYFDASSILYSKIRPNLNKVVVPGFAGICSADIYPIWPKDDAVDSSFLFQLLRSSLVLKPAIAASGRTGLPKINRPDLEAIEVPVPPRADQIRIAGILMKWDHAIEALDHQIISKDKLLKFLRECLTHGVRRLNQGNGTWPMTDLGSVSRQLTERNGSRFGRESVMGVTKADGLVPMKEHVIAEEITRYLILPPSAFAYNPMRINIGSIVMSELSDTVIVSPDYVVFACKPKQLDPRFLNHLRRTKAWSDFMTIAGNGSVRVRIYYASLADFEFHLPPLSEQAAIVEILDDAEREVVALRSERAAFERQRDALATSLLLGRLYPGNVGGAQ